MTIYKNCLYKIFRFHNYFLYYQFQQQFIAYIIKDLTFITLSYLYILLFNMSKQPQFNIPSEHLSLFSSQQRLALSKFQSSLNKTLSTIQTQKIKNKQLSKDKTILNKQIVTIHQKHQHLQTTHQLETQKLKKQFQTQLLFINQTHLAQIQKLKAQSEQKIHNLQNKISQQKQKKINKSFSRKLILILFQQLVQFIGAIVLMRIRFPRKLKLIRKFLPITFVMLRIGAFLLFAKMKKYGAVLNLANLKYGSKNIIKNIDSIVKQIYKLSQ